MRSIFLVLSLFCLNFVSAQTDIEDRDDSFITENNKNLLKINIKEPFYQIAAKGCKNFTAAGFEGGAAEYKKILTEYMFAYLNSDYYTINGDFTFTLSLDENGRVTNISGAPKVLFSEIFYDDMKYIVRRIKKNWLPATCDGIPIKSEMKIKMNIISVSSDL
ncbi:MAG: hypothetical protein LBE36_14420 [Flavobacteriaceae bacterium]|jgi:hypothetical protein|nr:hypothetical protein [Flavobacteriaceae bacterium]